MVLTIRFTTNTTRRLVQEGRKPVANLSVLDPNG